MQPWQVSLMHIQAMQQAWGQSLVEWYKCRAKTLHHQVTPRVSELQYQHLLIHSTTSAHPLGSDGMSSLLLPELEGVEGALPAPQGSRHTFVSGQLGDSNVGHGAMAAACHP